MLEKHSVSSKTICVTFTVINNIIGDLFKTKIFIENILQRMEKRMYLRREKTFKQFYANYSFVGMVDVFFLLFL